MNLNDRIFTTIANECKIIDEAEIKNYVRKRKEEILKQHEDKGGKIYAPTSSRRYWMTKLDPTNRNHCHPIYGKTKEELEEKIIQHYLKIPDVKNITVREAVIEALGGSDVLNPKTKLQTGHRDILRFDKHLNESIGDIPLSKFKPKHLKNALSNIINADEKIAAKEFSGTLTPLGKLAAWCYDQNIEIFDIEKCIKNWRILNANGHHVFSPKKAKGKEQAFSKAEASKIIKFALKTCDYMSLAVAILITTGLRLGEILGLKIDDVHLDDGYVFVVRKENTKSYKIEDYTKSNKQRRVDLSPLAIRLFTALIDLRNSDECDIPFLLLNYDKYGCLIKPHARAVDNYLRETIHKKVLGLDESFEARSSHDCRRTYASLEFFNGTDIYVIQQQMGHSDVSQTWDYIRDVADLEQRKSRLKGIGVDIDDVDDVDDDVVDTGNIIVYADYTQAKKIKSPANR